MPKKINEYDYLCISARIHAMENKLLTRERMERMLDAKTTEDAAKVLSECGYEELSELTPAALEKALGKARQAFFADLSRAAPDPGIVDVFRVKYDYHNAKVLLKAEAMGRDPEGLFIDAGRYPANQLRDDFVKEDLRRCSDRFRRALTEAKENLALTGDPQSADLILDQAYYDEMRAAAEAVCSAFLLGYLRVSIDGANLRSTVRCARMGRGADFLKKVLISGGSRGESSYLAVISGTGDLVALFAHGPLEAAAAAGAKAMTGGPLTEFERLCDNAVNGYLAQGKRVAFGEHPLIGYLYAKEAELTAIRIILTGRMAGLDADIIRERLRESYV